jgi:hypothetical protein
MHPADQFIAFHDLVVNGLGVDDVAARFGVSSLFVRQSLLTEKHVSASDRRACFVGVDAYVAAGGTLERDLFDEQHEGYLADPALLDRLVAERCASLVADLRAQGRAWVEPHLGNDYWECPPKVQPPSASADRPRPSGPRRSR